MTLIHEVQATAIGGRTGGAAASDGSLRLDFGPQAATPEHLVAMACAVSLLDAIRQVAAAHDIAVTPDSNATATVSLCRDGDPPGTDWRIALAVDLPGIAPIAARGLIELARQACPGLRAWDARLEIPIELI